MDKAAAALVEEFARPIGPLQFTAMSDVLILVMQVTSLRRVMEFAEFRLSEYTNREKVVKQGQEDRHVIRVFRHKTLEHGPCQIFLTPKQEQSLQGCVLYYRPFSSDCSSSDCYVFNLTGSETASCCSIMSSIAKTVKRVAVKAGFPSNLTSQILRRSQITALWEIDADPSWREKVGDQSVGVAMTL